MRCTLDSIFKVGFGVDLNCLDGSSGEGTEFMKAFDESNALVYWRYVDPFWKLKRISNIGSEASLKKNIKVIDDFVHNLISTKRKLLAMQQDSVSDMRLICTANFGSYHDLFGQLLRIYSLFLVFRMKRRTYFQDSYWQVKRTQIKWTINT